MPNNGFLFSNHSLTYILIHWMFSALAVYFTAAVIPGFRVNGFIAAMKTSAVIGLANYFIRPLLVFLSFPVTVLTLGLFIFVVDGAVLKICANLLKGFDIEGWWSAIFGSIFLTIVSSLMHYVFV